MTSVSDGELLRMQAGCCPHFKPRTDIEVATLRLAFDFLMSLEWQKSLNRKHTVVDIRRYCSERGGRYLGHVPGEAVLAMAWAIGFDPVMVKGMYFLNASEASFKRARGL